MADLIELSSPNLKNAAQEITVAVGPPVVRFSLRMRSEEASRIGSVEQFALNTAINTCATVAERTSVHVGPDEWVLFAPPSDRDSARAGIEVSLESTFFSLVDISDAQATFVVSGSRSPEVLNAGCPLDLSDAAFPSGSATRTLLGKSEIILIRPTQEQLYHVECLRSFAPYVLAFLREAALQRDILKTS